jgi:hypothetical protein
MSPPRLPPLWSAPACGPFSLEADAHPSIRGAYTSPWIWTSLFKVPEQRSSSTQPWLQSDLCERRINTFTLKPASMSSFLLALSESAMTTESNQSRFAPVERDFFCSLRRTRVATGLRASSTGMIVRVSKSPCGSRRARVSTWKRSEGGAQRSARSPGSRSFWKNWNAFGGGLAADLTRRVSASTCLQRVLRASDRGCGARALRSHLQLRTLKSQRS